VAIERTQIIRFNDTSGGGTFEVTPNPNRPDYVDTVNVKFFGNQTNMEDAELNLTHDEITALCDALHQAVAQQMNNS